MPTESQASFRPSVEMSTPSVFIPANPYFAIQVVPGFWSGLVAESR